MGVVGVIPAASKGTRLAPMPFNKLLLPIGYQQVKVGSEVLVRPKPVFQYIVEGMIAAGVQRLFVVICAETEPLMEYLGDGHAWGLEIAYLYQEELRGIPFALDLARPWLTDEVVVFGMPDTIIRPRDALARVLDDHAQSGAALTLGAFPTDRPSKFGMLALDEDDRVLASIDKPANSSLRYLWGFAAWGPVLGGLLSDYVAGFSAPREALFSDVIQLAVDRGLPVKAVRFDDGDYTDIGTIEDLQAAVGNYSTRLPS